MLKFPMCVVIPLLFLPTYCFSIFPKFARKKMSDKFIFRFVTVISVVVFALVIVLNRKLIPVTMETPSFVYLLPGLNAVINGTCSILLMASFYFIRKKNIPVHRSLNLTAFVLSAVFLISGYYMEGLDLTGTL